MDKIDRQLLNLIQKDATLTTADLADQVGLSPSPCARRIKRLEQEGVVNGYRAILSRGKVGIAMTVFVEVSLNNHQASSIDEFEYSIVEMDEVISCHVVSGAYDYLLEVVSRDLEGYENFTRKLQRLENVKDIHTHLAIREVKGNGSLPVYA
ncbi:Lrp/AsnC family transcriptional regulator [Vibrio natriegens]|jgi:DNA-binding Lrp family transcriptional regulator|uniref:AsnC family transcriptional regulator n=1 Tax=Vibrio natriegens NBRC 15636 = ATCC 14048 = DSM 759 TaxID=1219067 RepID=A0AAN1CXZ4_VIBNA|nr:Lrp/AsnC family transcriptional regulator [Vibrio natriegens]CAH0526254.1 Leucine-responsive regulatory protein [Catenococcus thiocycli]ALR17860.1 AsnC family transcriptional regulator [Vibrio natriegens NBRC 15636 = ATCC 14048 = DSM 759]ANQ15352.1 AsnC family transcriptional regulator [Vibrio natriegens NBRC 15636 = ATCC 14048 = DSM 759]ANQ28037.1 AsnC family transcriptional regulator [Vibrio natriegens]EPM41058.1 AsnC family transcriptional regulator [Vibrio natriegens NBRC 15636 = ATCC 1